MAPAVAAALVAGVVALVTTLATVYAGRRLEDRRRVHERAELMRRYRDPLLRSAFDLQSRLWNIVRQGFLDVYYVHGAPTERAYAVDNTLYVIGEFFSWVEIVRREVQFLDLGAELKSEQLVDQIDEIRSTFSRDDISSNVFKVFRGEQRAIGEIMSTDVPVARDSPGPRSECIGYASFVERRQDPDFSKWFAKLADDVEQELSRDSRAHSARLVAVQGVLIDLLDFLDPNGVYFQPESRSRLA